MSAKAAATIVITGPQGSGKTRLTRELTKRLEKHDGLAVEVNDEGNVTHQSDADAQVKIVTQIYGTKLAADLRLVPLHSRELFARRVAAAARHKKFPAVEIVKV